MNVKSARPVYAFGLLGVLLPAILFVATPHPATAQVLYGSVVGTVSDPSGAVIPGAAVTLTSKQIGASRTEKSDEGGRYSFVNVLPGTYDVSVTATGFRTFLAQGVDVTPNTIQRIDSKLEVGQIADQVTVEASAVALQTDKSDTHTEITTAAITNMPIGGYRNYQTLINLVPGALPAALQNSITDTPGRALNTHINGGNAQTNITRIDGATSVNVWLPHHVGYVTPGRERRSGQHHHRFGRCRTGDGGLVGRNPGDQVRHQPAPRQRV